MSKSRLRAATIRVEPELWERIERLAQADRRPVANYLALVIADAIAARSAGSGSVMAGPPTRGERAG
jgi:predicted transcriptional regulator